jgi:hypothetical protein
MLLHLLATCFTLLVQQLPVALVLERTSIGPTESWNTILRHSIPSAYLAKNHYLSQIKTALRVTEGPHIRDFPAVRVASLAICRGQRIFVKSAFFQILPALPTDT